MRVFEVLDEIIEAVESAKGVPMSSSVILNRPALLDLLDDLRDAFPASVEDAREIIEQRDTIVESARAEAQRVEESCNNEAYRLVQDARAEAEGTVSTANAEATAMVSRAQAEAESLLASAKAKAQARIESARAEAERLVEDGHREQQRLVTEHEVHRSASDQAASLLDDAEQKATKLRRDADKYVDDNLSGLALTLQKLSATVERGRSSMQTRRPGGDLPGGVFDQNG